MELFRSELFYIFVRNECSLWWNRTTGAFSVRSAWDLSDIEDIECLGITEGILGVVDHSNIFDPRLMIIKESVPVGNIYFHHTIFKIKSIVLLNMGVANQEIELSPCTKHSSSNSITSTNSKKMGKLFENSAFLNKTVGAVKNVSNTIKCTTKQAATQVKQTVNKKRDPKLAERFEKRLADELHKIFDDSDSFYYSRTLDLTNSLQRQCEIETILMKEKDTEKAVSDISRWWKHVDDRFFWNKHMMKDIIALGSPLCDQWILPVIQGYVQLSQIAVEQSENPLNTESLANNSCCDENFTMGIISRRSRYQAGTRYNRRGIEPGGKVANYVETEQIVSITCKTSVHRASFVQVRGSVPIFWSQPDYKFRPPPRLDKDEETTHEAFKKHLDEELSIYKHVCIVNLVEQQGREKIIWETYGDHVFKYNSPDVVYVTFDFHEYCRGMHYENVSLLINAVTEVIAEMNFCWRDDQGLICSQTSVFRVNCIDCLDRTNVVQTALAKYVLEMQLCRLGLATPGSVLPAALRQAFLTMWADNGDVLSRQYAGTKALKGDYTRTGERKFSGLMKDGVASANRYIIQHFKDAITQYAIDIALGQTPNESTIDKYSYWNDLKTATLMVLDNTESYKNRDLMPTYFGHALCSEFSVAEILFAVGRYYLSTFKDALRQVAVDSMTGESRSLPETLLCEDCKCISVKVLMFNDQQPPDTAAMAQRVKTLIDDCKKLLVDSEPVLGSWGLIDADPNTGDPHETVMDSVVLLTSSAYYVADYDETSDRLLGVQRVPLQDVTMIQLGTHLNNSNIFSVPRKSDSEPTHCIRIHYTLNGESGYFHMFRSTTLRFFNNMAVAINTKDEMIESLHSICESIIAIKAADLPPIPFQENVKLEKKKSKVPANKDANGLGQTSIYQSLSRLPAISKNMADTQIVADIRNVDSQKSNHATSSVLDQLVKIESQSRHTIIIGSYKTLQTATQSVRSKALTNMSEQFSKLNKLGARARPSLQLKFDQSASRTKKMFTLGTTKADKKKGSLSDGMSSDYSSDDENRTNIFEPTLDNFEMTQHYIGKTQKKDENDCDLIQNPLYQSKIEPNEEAIEEITPHPVPSVKTPSNISKINPFNDEKPETSTKEEINLQDLGKNLGIAISKTPEIQVESDTYKSNPPNSLVLSQKNSHSTNDIAYDDVNESFHRSNSQQDVTLNIQQSHSESALRQFKTLASPVTSSTKDLVLSPLTKLAKGVQTLGANLDPRKMKGSTAVKHISEQQYEEHKKLQEKWKDCNTRLVAL